jgi:hypothetical protein
LRFLLWCCWRYDILCTITVWVTCSLSNYILWGCEIEVSDCPVELHLIIYDDHKMWFHISHVLTSVQQSILVTVKVCDRYHMFLSLWMHTDPLWWLLTPDLRILFFKALTSTFEMKRITSGKMHMIQTSRTVYSYYSQRSVAPTL